MTIDTRTPAEIAYDNLKSGAAYSKPEPAEQAELRSTLYPTPIPLSAEEAVILNLLIELSPPDPDELPAVLDVASAHQQALAEWEGRTRTLPSGALHRSPQLPEVEIGELKDGTPVGGTFDTDDTPLCVCVEWEGFSFVAGEDGFELNNATTDKDLYHFTIEQWRRLKTLVNSDIVDQVLYFAQAWEAQRAK
jgi:hypothetical protein